MTENLGGEGPLIDRYPVLVAGLGTESVFERDRNIRRHKVADVATESRDLLDQGGTRVAELLVRHDKQGFHLGFEVRVELISATTGAPFVAQLTRGDAEARALRDGDTVYGRATRIPPVAGVRQQET